MPTPSRPDTRHLERRHLTWFATVYIPRPLQATLGKKLSRSLGTHDLPEAQRRRHRAVAEFQDRIAAARKAASGDRSGDSSTASVLMAEAMAEREHWRSSDGGEDDVGSMVISDRAEAIEASHGEAAALAYSRVASGLSTPIAHHVTGWLGEAQYPARSQVQHRGTVAELERWCAKAGVSTDLESVTREVAGRFIAALVSAKAARATVNRKLSTLRAYWSWLHHRGHTASDPWTGQRLARGRLAQEHEAEVRPVTDAELQSLLTSGADTVLADFILIAALSGARVESIAQLQVRDCQGGLFNIRRDKTRSGTRKVPIHSGLTALIDRRITGKSQADWLFPECVPTQTGSRSASVVMSLNKQSDGFSVFSDHGI
jgi:site-specific recombinase XerC